VQYNKNIKCQWGNLVANSNTSWGKFITLPRYIYYPLRRRLVILQTRYQDPYYFLLRIFSHHFFLCTATTFTLYNLYIGQQRLLVKLSIFERRLFSSFRLDSWRQSSTTCERAASWRLVRSLRQLYLFLSRSLIVITFSAFSVALFTRLLFYHVPDVRWSGFSLPLRFRRVSSQNGWTFITKKAAM